MKISIALLYLALLTSCGVVRYAQMPELQPREIHREYPRLTSTEIDFLRSTYSDDIEFCEEFLEPTLIALQHYPELRGVEISFEYSDEATTMAARPHIGSMFGDRRYKILINDSDDFEGIHLQDVPFNAQIGIIGHELAHIADYESRNIFGVLGILFEYADKRRKGYFEKQIDKATIERGLGWQLYDWAEYSMYGDNGATDEYKAFKRANYLQPKQIKRLIKAYGSYAID